MGSWPVIVMNSTVDVSSPRRFAWQSGSARAAAMLGATHLVVELGDHRRAPRLVAAAGADAAGLGIASVVDLYFTIRATDDWSRVKTCAAPDCQWAYLATSRNRSRRWCDMADYGNRAKNRTWRERRHAADNHQTSEASNDR